MPPARIKNDRAAEVALGGLRGLEGGDRRHGRVRQRPGGARPGVPDKQPAAFAAKPALYQIGGVANETLVPLLQRRVDPAARRLGRQVRAEPAPNQLIKVDGKVMAIAMMVTRST